MQMTVFYLYPNSENMGSIAADTENSSSILGGWNKRIKTVKTFSPNIHIQILQTDLYIFP